MKLKIYTDGASRGNPGQSGAGAAIYDNTTGHQLAGLYKYLGTKTNNQAEYSAIWLALEWAKQKYPNCEIDIFADSQLVCRQLSGQYKIKNKDLQTAATEIKKQMQTLGKTTFYHIPREQNKTADKLANKAIDQYNNIIKK